MATRVKSRVCKDCAAEGRALTRPAPHPGPRCTTHHRGFKTGQKARKHDVEMQRVFGLAPGEYAALYASQGGRCAILGCRATGTGRRRLAVDHSHKCQESHDGKIARCCIRGLVCATHNQMFADNRDDPAAFMSMAFYLDAPPARTLVYTVNQ